MKLNISVIILVLITASMTSCQSTNTNNKPAKVSESNEVASTSDAKSNTPAKYLPKKEGLSRAYFASGCFWCVEAVYESVNGVEEVISGYSGGHTKSPTYASSNTGKTGHAEAIEVFYDANVIDFTTLVDIYFGSQDVTQVNGQGGDKGSQYRSIIFYQNADEKAIIDNKVTELNKKIAPLKAAAEITSFEIFWVAEDYHQNFERLHPDQGYIRAVSVPRLKRFQKKFPQLIREGSH